jgi:peptidoglycan/LPS O-acetylase OafA/YrhL
MPAYFDESGREAQSRLTVASSLKCDSLRRNISLNEIPSLAGLRAFAALTVVLCHVVSPLYSGRSAVTLFFVLSGFLITLRLLDELRTRHTISILRFYARRARRLLPAYYLWLFFVILLLTGRITGEIAAAAFYVSDYYAAWVREGIISHTWSLAVEEQFYLLWPAVLLSLCRFRAGMRNRILVFAILAIQLARFILGARYPIYFYYSFEVRLDALLVGCAMAIWLTEGWRIPGFLLARGAWLVPVAGLCLNNFLPLPWLHATADTVAAYCSAALIIQTIHSTPFILNNRIAAALGAWSYSLYLYHVLVRWIYMQLVQGASDGSVTVHGWRNRIAVIALSIVASWASYRFVELPWLRRRSAPDLVPAPLAVAQ